MISRYLAVAKHRAVGRPHILIALRLLSSQHRQAISPPPPPLLSLAPLPVSVAFSSICKHYNTQLFYRMLV